MRRGFALHELLISLTVLSGVLALATHFSLGQSRFFRGVADVSSLRSQLGQAGEILGGVLWSMSPANGDLRVALDSAIEIRLTTGSAVVCASGAGRVVVPAPVPGGGHVFAAFARTPATGDVVTALFSDSAGTTWLSARVAAPPEEGPGCPALAGVQESWDIVLTEPITVPPGAVLRFLRPLRVSLYRAGDQRWYLGARDWNGEADRFNTVQPLAGPLRSWSSNPDSSGLRFLYRDAAGVELSFPVDPSRVASITVVGHGVVERAVLIQGLGRAGDRHADSITVTTGLRNSR